MYGAAGFYFERPTSRLSPESPTCEWDQTSLFYVPELHSIKLNNVEFRKELLVIRVITLL
jgi:hypothetical protein